MIKILHVDDDTFMHTLVSHNFLNLNKELEFVFADSGENAMEVLNEKSFDCIISDFQMPKMDGMEFLKALRARKDETPFIFLTGQGNEKIAVEAFHNGADDYFTKDEGIAHYERILNSIKKQIITHNLKYKCDTTKEAFEKCEQFLSVIFDVVEDKITILDKELNVLKVNKAVRNAYPHSLPFEGKKKCYEVYNKKAKPCAVCPSIRAINSGKVEKDEVPYFHSEGTKGIEELFSFPVMDKENKIIGVVEYARDITKRQEIKKKLDKLVNELTALHNLNQKMISDPSLKPVMEAGIKGIVTLFNLDLGVLFLRKSDKLFLQNSYLNNPKIKYEEVLSHCVGECLCGLSVSTGKPIYCIDINKDIRCSLEECKKAGLRSFAALPLNIGENIIGVLGLASATSHDFQKNSEILKTFSNMIAIATQNALLFDEVKQHASQLINLNRELESKNKEMRLFVDMVAHDLKSPLGTLKGFTKILENTSRKARFNLQKKEPQLTEKELESLLVDGLEMPSKYMNRCVSKMERLVQSILELSKVGHASFELIDLDMNSLISKVKSTFEYKIKEKNITVEVCDLPPCIGDIMQIDQVFSNLLCNALKYLNTVRQGFIRISGKVDNNNAVYCVEDNGIGIQESVKKRVFEMFYRVNPAFAEGEGLGLAIVDKIISRHGGKIWVESEPDKGSKFFVSLPKGK